MDTRAREAFKRLPFNTKRLIFGGFFFVVFGCLGVPYFYHGFAKSDRAATWPRIEAQVIERGVSSYSSRSGRRKYGLEIEYLYYVNAKAYRGDQIAFGFGHPKWTSREQAFEHLPEIEETIEVSYDPNSPEKSVIYISPTPKDLQFVFLFGLGSVAAIGGWAMSLSLKKLYSGRRKLTDTVD